MPASSNSIPYKSRPDSWEVLPVFIDPIQNFRLIFESPAYPILRGTENGHLLIKTRFADTAPEVVWSSAAKIVRFRVVNTLCTDDELAIFDTTNFNRFVKDKVEKLSNDLAHVYEIDWKGRIPFDAMTFSDDAPWPSR